MTEIIKRAQSQIGSDFPIFMCAWHDADAVLLAERPEVKRPPLPDGRETPTGQGQCPEMGCLEEA